MKKLIIPLLLLVFGCSKSSDYEQEKDSIISLLEAETTYASQADSTNWASCWINSDQASFTITTAEGVQTYDDFISLASQIGTIEPFDLQMSRENYNFIFGEDQAFVSFDQSDNWGNSEGRKTKETRTLQKVDGNWKILKSTVIDISSFDIPISEPFHMQATSIPPNPNSGFTNIYGIGGMSIGYIDVPEPMDFTPLFSGLPHDYCSSPHWGYVIEGEITIMYLDGTEEKVKGGEVFYWPAPHTGWIDKSVKFVDFSPDSEFIPLMEHIASNLSATNQE